MRRLWWLAFLIGCQPQSAKLERDPKYTLTDYLTAAGQVPDSLFQVRKP
jgi:hypothetical protein